MASRYHEVYDSWQRDPQAFWAAAAGEIDWFKRWDKVFDPDAGVYGRWFTGARVQHLPTMPRPPCRARPRRSGGADPRQRDHRQRSRASPIASCATRSRRLLPCCATTASARATASSSTCRWCRKPPSPCSPAPASARSIRWCSAASPRTSWRPASTTRAPKLIDLGFLRHRAWTRRSPTSRCSTRRSRWPTNPPATCLIAAARRNWAATWWPAATSTMPSMSARRAPQARQSNACRSPPPIRSTSSTPPARPASPRASCATMAATWSR